MTASPWLRRRYLLDQSLAAVASAATLPVVALLALAIRRVDGGRGLIRLTRIGADGRPFRMWKLRTMRVTAADGSAGGPAITTADDDRITSIGRTLRRWRLDELPQLWNVARGEMALVGPRPETPDYVDPADPAWRTILHARPGIAGLTQVLVHDWEPGALAASAAVDPYRDDVLPVKLRLDRWYVDQASPRLDLQILTALIGSFAFGQPPLRLRRLVERAGLVPTGLLGS